MKSFGMFVVHENRNGQSDCESQNMCFSGKALALVDFPYGNGKKKIMIIIISQVNRCIQYKT